MRGRSCEKTVEDASLLMEQLDYNLLFHQQPLAANRVQNLQQQCPQQLLRWDRRPPCPGLHLVEASRKPLQRLVGQPPDDPQGVVLAHPLLRAEAAEHRVLMKILSSHRENNTTHLCFYRKCSDGDFFSTLLVIHLQNPLGRIPFSWSGSISHV